MVGAAEGPGHASWAIITCGFPPCQAFEAPTLHALRSIARTSYRVSFLLKSEWSQSSHPTVRGRLAEIFPQAEFPIHYRRFLHS